MINRCVTSEKLPPWRANWIVDTGLAREGWLGRWKNFGAVGELVDVVNAKERHADVCL
jgi:hypothetical protein